MTGEQQWVAKVGSLKQVLCALILAEANEKMEVCRKKHTSYSEQLWLRSSSKTGQCCKGWVVGGMTG